VEGSRRRTRRSPRCRAPEHRHNSGCVPSPKDDSAGDGGSSLQRSGCFDEALDRVPTAVQREHEWHQRIVGEPLRNEEPVRPSAPFAHQRVQRDAGNGGAEDDLVEDEAHAVEPARTSPQ
jgi:hypothetical protein